MSTITKEWLQQKIADMEATRDEIPFGLDEDDSNTLAAMKLALASLEAEAVITVGDDGGDALAYRRLIQTFAPGTKLYTAPPAPVYVPDEIRLLQSEVTIWKDRWELLRELFREVADALGCDVKDNQAMLDKIEMLQGAAENSPVIPDGWVACSERMPENDDFVYIWPRPDFGVELHVAQYGKFDKRDAGWYAQVYEQNYGIEYYPVKVTHWMPLPNSPKE